MKCCAEEHGHGYQCHNANLQNWRTIHGELLLYNLEDLNKMIYALRGRGASTTHVQKCCLPKTEFSGQKNFGLDMLPNLGSLVTRFHFSVNISAQLQLEAVLFSHTKPPPWIGVENRHFYQEKEGRTQKSTRSGTCKTKILLP